VVPRHIGHEQRSARLLLQVCERWRVPNDCKELAEVVGREHGNIHRSHELNAAAQLRLLERCDGRQLAAWMRQTCLDEKPARTGKLPSLSPALLRQLAGMGNNLNQIARKVNAGGAGHDRVQIVAALMAIDAGLERLRHAVLETGGDDDR
jgi:hypothetical protein